MNKAINVRNADFIANGPEELKEILSHLLIKTEKPSKASYIHYKNGAQESLIKVTSSFQIFHYDLLGRPATMMLRQVIQSVIDQCNPSAHLEDISRRDMFEINKTGFLSGSEKSRVVLGDEPATSSRERLDYARQRLDQASRPKEFVAKKRVGLFPASGREEVSVSDKPLLPPSKKQKLQI